MPVILCDAWEAAESGMILPPGESVFPATMSHDLSPHLPHLYALVILFLFYQQTLNRCILHNWGRLGPK